jgi:hypothetical protein
MAHPFLCWDGKVPGHPKNAAQRTTLSDRGNMLSSTRIARMTLAHDFHSADSPTPPESSDSHQCNSGPRVIPLMIMQGPVTMMTKQTLQCQGDSPILHSSHCTRVLWRELKRIRLREREKAYHRAPRPGERLHFPSFRRRMAYRKAMTLVGVPERDRWPHLKRSSSRKAR